MLVQLVYLIEERRNMPTTYEVLSAKNIKSALLYRTYYFFKSIVLYRAYYFFKVYYSTVRTIFLKYSILSAFRIYHAGRRR